MFSTTTTTRTKIKYVIRNLHDIPRQYDWNGGHNYKLIRAHVCVHILQQQELLPSVLIERGLPTAGGGILCVTLRNSG